MMRRHKQQLTKEECVELLRSSTSGVLSLCGLDMQPYGVPLSHVYHNDNLYFHCALTGYKLAILAQNEKASFTVIAQDEIHPEKFTTYYRSVIVFGKVRIIEDIKEKSEILENIGRRCNPNDNEALFNEIKNGLNRCICLEMSIEKLTGKQAIELVHTS